MTPPFPTKMIQDGDTKKWLVWLREHGSALRCTTEAEFNNYWNQTFLLWLRTRTPEQRSAYVRELMFARQWAQCGFPQVVVGEKLFASLAATRIPSDAAPELGLPWECFIVRVPDRFRMPIRTEHVVVNQETQKPEVQGVIEDRVGYLRVQKTAGGQFSHQLCVINDVVPFGQVVMQFNGMSDLLKEHDDEDVVSGDFVGPNFIQRDADIEVSGLQLTILRALARAFAGAVIEMMSPKSHGGSAVNRPINHRTSGTPNDGVTVTITRNIVVDCRDWLEGELRGEQVKKKRPMGVQSLIRGHWKRQVFGTGRSERRYIHIEPYWRGPEDSPIAGRSHIIADPAPQD